MKYVELEFTSMQFNKGVCCIRLTESILENRCMQIDLPAQEALLLTYINDPKEKKYYELRMEKDLRNANSIIRQVFIERISAGYFGTIKVKKASGIERVNCSIAELIYTGIVCHIPMKIEEELLDEVKISEIELQTEAVEKLHQTETNEGNFALALKKMTGAELRRLQTHFISNDWFEKAIVIRNEMADREERLS